MFKFVSPDLPAKPSNFAIAPAFRILWGDSREMGAFLRFNLYAANLPFDPVKLPISDPVFIGYYTRIDLEFPILNPSIFGFDQVVDAVEALPNKFWIDGTTLNFYSIQPLDSPLSIHLTITDYVPLPTSDYVWVVEVPENMTANSVRSQGLTCSFTQLGSTITILGSPQTNLRVGDEILIAGQVSATVPNFFSRVATFYMPELEFLDRMEWLGKTFSPSQNALQPQVNEFVWHNHYCTIFTDLNLTPINSPVPTETSSFLGAITYQRPSSQ
jgi:hypothetical protein